MRTPSRGQGFPEYALIILLVALVIIGVLALMGPTLSGIFSIVPTSL
jgi:Flp pilus assembly pilin Flp